jgi:3',5'-cyclic AMP phosphodiesterase CpdA
MRIAHLSDVHLLSLEGAAPEDFLVANKKRVLGGINVLLNRGRHYKNEVFEAMVEDLNRRGVDHVACTGDLTNLALEPEFRFARGIFDRLNVGPGHVTCIPGNHDAYVTGVEALFERAFGPYCETDPGWEQPERWPIVRIRGDVAVIACSSSRPTFVLAAYGELGGAQLRRLERVLGDERLAGKFRLVMIHHPPAGRWARSRLRGLHDHAAFAAVVARAGAELVLHGHEHLDLHEELYGPGGARVPVRGIPSGSYHGDREERRAAYRVYAIERRPGRERPIVAGEELRLFPYGDTLRRS